MARDCNNQAAWQRLRAVSDAWLSTLDDKAMSDGRLVRDRLLAGWATLTLRLDDAGHVLGLGPAQVKRSFAAVCQRAGPTGPIQLSHSRQARLVKLTNGFLSHLEQNGLLIAPPPVQPSRHRKRALTVDPEPLQRYRSSDLHRLWLHFAGQVPTADPDEETLLFETALALIVDGGLCWHGAFESIYALRLTDVLTIAQGFIRVPHRPQGPAGHASHRPRLRIYLAGPAAAYVGRAILWRTRPPGRGARPAIALPGDAPLWPGLADQETGSQQSERIRTLRRAFYNWLQKLCQEAHVPPLNLPTLYQVTAAHLLDIYPPFIVAALRGQLAYAPVPDHQAHLFASYCQTALPDPSTSSTVLQTVGSPMSIAERLRKNGPDPIAGIASMNTPQGDVPYYRDLFRTMRVRYRSYSRSMGHKPARDEAIAELTRYGFQLLGEIHNPQESLLERDLGHALLEVFQRDLGPHLDHSMIDDETLLVRVQRYNVAALCAWLIEQITQRVRPSTLESYCDDLQRVLRLEPALCIVEFDQEIVEDLLAADYAARTRRRLKTPLRSWLEFLHHQGLPVVKLDWSSPELQVSQDAREVEVLSQGDFDRLLAWLSMDEGQATRDARLAAHLAYYAGLRISEICNLLIGDLLLCGEPCIYVFRSKRRKNRVVPLVEVPAAVMEEWLAFHRERLAHATPVDPLLVEDEKHPCQPGPLSARVIARMVQAGIRSDKNSEEESAAVPVDFHRLRHCYANRLLVRGYDLRYIAMVLGHSAPAVTVNSYLHAVDWLQGQYLQAYGELLTPTFITQEHASRLLVVSRRHVHNLVHTYNVERREHSIELLEASALPPEEAGRMHRGGKDPLFLSYADLIALQRDLIGQLA